MSQFAIFSMVNLHKKEIYNSLFLFNRRIAIGILFGYTHAYSKNKNAAGTLQAINQ
jgi:hypothetical protein